jgi:hypothetical protein
MASPHSFHERAAPVSDTGRPLSSAPAPLPSASGPRPPPFRLEPPPPTYAFCSLAVSFDSMVKMAS